MQPQQILLKIVNLLKLLLTLQSVTTVTPSFILNFTHLDCQPDQPGLFKQIECRIENVLLPTSPSPIRKTVSVMNADVTFARPPKPHLYSRTIGRIKPKVGEISTILDVRLDICEFLGNKFASKMFSILSKIVMEYLNERPTCPMKTNFTYKARNFHFNPDDLPSYVPEAILMLEFNFFEREVQFGHVYMWIEVIEQRLRQSGQGKPKRRRH